MCQLHTSLNLQNFTKSIVSICLLLVISLPSRAQLNLTFEPMANASAINSPNPVQALDILYDDIEAERQAFHLFLPDTEGIFPLVIYIHGGGFTGGSRDKVFQDQGLQNSQEYFLENNIAFITIGYRLIASTGSDPEGVIKSLRDSKRALQFIRYHAADLKIDSERIVLMGSSAGAGTALWLAANPDMADPNSSDPVLRESTRVSAISLNGSQATYDIPKWEEIVYADFGFTLTDLEELLTFERLSNFYGGLDSVNQVYHDPAIIQYREEVDMLALLSSDDPPIYINARSGAELPEQDPFHHSSQSQAIHDHATAANVSEVKTTIRFTGFDTTEGETGDDFLIRHLTTEPSVITSSNAQEITNPLTIYPNPTTERLYVSSSKQTSPYHVYDLNGQTLLSGNGSEVDVSQLENGVYLIRLEQEVLRFVKK